MIQITFNKLEPHTYISYGRYSTTNQNEFSNHQQFNAIDETVLCNNLPWTKIRTYEDEGVKGRYRLKYRPGSGQMLRDIETGLIKPSLILVHTWERLSREDEAEEVCRNLLNNHGILVLTADSNFADPTGTTGMTLKFLEKFRAKDGNRVKSLDVVRGKKDALQRGKWPGGPWPFGFKLEKVVDNSGPKPRVHSVLVHDPETIWIRREILFRACETGWGSSRLAAWLNGRDDIPDKLKPFNEPTITGWLDSPINIGTYVWNRHHTDIVNDCRVIKKNLEEDSILQIKNFCEPVVDKEVYEKIQQMRDARRRPRQDDDDGKLIPALSAGQSLKYCLTGLVVCDECNSSMIAKGSGRISLTGTKYIYRVCARNKDAACDNGSHVREDDLQKAALTRLRARLLPASTQPDAVPDWFPKVVQLVQQYADETRRLKPDMAAAKQSEIKKIEGYIQGWQMSLAQPDLDPVVRTDLNEKYAEAKREINTLQTELNAIEVAEKQLNRVIDPEAVLERLRRLDQVLAESNPTLLNIELSKHIADIRIDRTGKVVMRGTHLGVFDGAVDLLSLTNADIGSTQHDQEDSDRSTTAGQKQDSAIRKVNPRRRARRRTPSLTSDSGLNETDVQRCLDPDRFADLAEEFFWEETFMIEPRKSWSATNADRIYREWLELENLSELARRHGKSVPTIRKARDLGKKNAEAKQAPPS